MSSAEDRSSRESAEGGHAARDAGGALAVAEHAINKHVNRHALDVDRLVKRLEQARHGLEEHLGIDAEGSEEIAAEAIGKADWLLGLNN